MCKQSVTVSRHGAHGVFRGMGPIMTVALFRKVISGLLFVVLEMSPVLAEEPRESFYSQINRTVIRLEHFETVNKEGAKFSTRANVPDGTGFFVANGNNLMLVTARHVVEKPYNLHARVQCKNSKTGEKKVVLLKLPHDKWTYHSNNGDKNTNYVDVAVIKLFAMRDWSIVPFRYEGEDSPDQEKNQFPDHDAEPPKPILVFGFPANIGFELVEQSPLVRFGIISLKAGSKFIKLENGKYVEERCSLIDSRIFGGNSGGPVMNQITLENNEPKLLGLIIAASKNLDFAIMEPVSRIRETILLARDKEPGGSWEEIQGKVELAREKELQGSSEEIKP